MEPTDTNSQPSFGSGVDNIGVSDSESDINPNALEGISNIQNKISVATLAYGNKIDIAAIAYGGNTMDQSLSAQSARITRLQRGVPRMRRGTLVPSIPRTKSQTIYARDPGQALQNKVLSHGQSGVAVSGTPVPGTSNTFDQITGAINRYRTNYPTLIQPTETNLNIT